MRTLVKLISAIGLWAFALTPMTATAQEITDIQSNGNLHLRGYGSGFITGETHLIDADTARGGVTSGGTVAGGYSMYNQMYVAFMLPQAQNGKKHISDRHHPRLLLKHKIVADHARWTDWLGRILRPSGL